MSSCSAVADVFENQRELTWLGSVAAPARNAGKCTATPGPALIHEVIVDGLVAASVCIVGD